MSTSNIAGLNDSVNHFDPGHTLEETKININVFIGNEMICMFKPQNKTYFHLKKIINDYINNIY